MFGGMRVKMQKMSVQMGGNAAEVGLVPQLSDAEMQRMAGKPLSV